MQSKKLSQSGRRVTTYAELDSFVQAFAAERLNLLFIIGRPGLQKSEGLRAAVGPGACWIEGHNSPLAVYMKLYRHRDCPVVIDDADCVYGSQAGFELLRSLCQTNPLKRVCWNTRSRLLDDEGVPREFTTTSKVAIVANEWQALPHKVAALVDRGHLVVFDPSPLEVHLRTAAWFWDQDIYDFIGRHLALAAVHSMRTYVKAWELKKAGLPWENCTLDSLVPDEKTRLVAQLQVDPFFQSEAERVRAFKERGGGTRSTYFAHKNKLEPSFEVPEIMLTSPVPPDREGANTALRWGRMIRRQRTG